jgi:hypothetical protein
MLEFAAPGGGEGGVPFAGGPVLSGLPACGGDAGLPGPALPGGAGVVVVEPSELVEVEEPSDQCSTTGPFGVEDTEVMPTPLASLVPGGNVVVEEPSGLVVVVEPSAQCCVVVPSGAIVVPGGGFGAGVDATGAGPAAGPSAFGPLPVPAEELGPPSLLALPPPPSPPRPPRPPAAPAAPPNAPNAGGMTLLSLTQLAQKCRRLMTRSIIGRFRGRR